MFADRIAVYGLIVVAMGGRIAAGREPVPLAREWIRASASTEYSLVRTPADRAADGSGLTGDLHDDHPEGYTMWVSATGGGVGDNNPAGVEGPAWIRFEFSQPFTLESAVVWNHNQRDRTDRGLRRVAVHLADADGLWAPLGERVLTRASGLGAVPPTDTIPLGGTLAGGVLITALPGDGSFGSDYYGLSEVRFYGHAVSWIPESWPVSFQSLSIDDDYTRGFSPQLSGWLGSDVAHSIPLAPGRRLWLFGDTFIGTVHSGRRAPGAVMINNTIAIENPVGQGVGDVRFYWNHGPASFFPHRAGTPGDYYWPTNGVVLDGRLFLFCYSAMPGGGLGFALDHTTLIRVTNPEADPTEWIWDARDFGIGGNEFGLHSALYVDEPHVYFLGFEGQGFLASAVLARARIDALLAGGTSEILEYWVETAEGPAWGPAPEDLVPLFRPANTETQIQYVPAWRRYFVTTYNPFQSGVYLTTATSLTGPWEPPARLYNVPEHLTTSFAILSYAARLHPELSTATGELVLSYATNSLDGIAPLFTTEGLRIYHPRFVRFQLVGNGGSGPDIWSIR